ncbi:hypothetical protein HanPI659440_Chr08g0298791 [Helianthus annuus]|nr:hypothetical protein HanPI659440_Chr08g0298791 [Helianthus annuus]
MIGYDPPLLFRCFFRLTKNDDWVTFEISQVDVCLTSSMVTTSGSWEDRFFWISESIVPFRLVWRHPYAVLNELEPFKHEIDGFMFALDFIKSDDTSNVVFGDTEATSDEDVVVRGTEHRFEGSGYVNVPNVKGFTRFGASKAFIHWLTRRMLKVPDHPSASEPVQLRDVIEASNIWTLGLRKKHEDLSLVISKESKAAGFCSSMNDDLMISKVMMGACNLVALLLEGVSRFRKKMQEYEVFSKKRDEMKASMVVLKEAEGYAEKEKALLFEDLSNFVPAQD